MNRMKFSAVEGFRFGFRLTLGLVIVTPLLAQAQTWVPQAGVHTNVTATNNATLSSKIEKRVDVIALVQPNFWLSGKGVSFKLNARAGADAVHYARSTRANHVAPLLDIDVSTALVDKVVFLDAAATRRESELDPYAPRVEAGAAQNRQRTSSYRINPYLSYKAIPNIVLFAGLEAGLLKTESQGNQRQSKVQWRAERQPTPLGGSVEYVRQDTRYANQGRWRLETYKALGSLALNDEWTVGPLVGRERTVLLLQDHTDPLYGAHLRWVPSSTRSQLSAEVVNRFFGTGWDVSLRHRSPSTVLALQWNRLPVLSNGSLGTTTGNELTGFLDAILTNRYPDATQRAALVDELIAKRNLRTDLQGAVNVTAQYAQLQTGVKASWVLVGHHNTLALSGYRQTRRQLSRSGDVLSGLGNGNADNQQTGAIVNFNHKFTAKWSINLVAHPGFGCSFW
jgi:uncharacterized protein (PEP-CTERM system associated)